jgi:thioredoxin 1
MAEHLDKDTFMEKIFDFENNQEWAYKGELPSIIDFYADWCAPCRIVAPILDEISAEYAGKVNVYKINTEKEQELAAIFGIRSIPSILFIPKDGKPQMAVGALPKPSIENAIRDVLGVNKNETVI